ncbi:MAG TPA: DNA replication/repair protein RecF [Sphingomicrobium sp.]|nr:DNA replication/repair protein RecF [Sphingomicrobium sp.]
MPVSRLALADFRSYASALMEPGAGFVLLFGENGAGKTNLLEAVSLLAPGRGLRGAPLSDMARQGGTGGFAVAAHLNPLLPLAGGEEERSDEGVGATGIVPQGGPTPRPPPASGRGSISIGTGALASAPERRQVRINGAPAAVNSLSEWLSVLWLTPAMDRLFTGSTGERRRFLDRLVLALEPGHAHHSTRYDAAMRARNKLLAEPGWDETWLASLELAMAEHGAAIAAAREGTATALEQALAEVPEDEFARASIALEGWEGGDLAPVLRANRQRDAAAGRAIEGPHRHDLGVTHRAKQMPAAQSSTGEQKALLLGLVLAHAELVTARRGEPPILLLDEVAAHLDPIRREALFRRLEGRGQVWMTATEAALFDGIGEASRFAVQPGRIVAQ